MCLACFPHDRKHPFLRVLGQVRVWEAVRDASTGIALEDDGNDVQARLTEGSVSLSNGTSTVGAVDVGGGFCCLQSVFL